MSEEGKLLATLQRRQKKIFGGPLARILSTRNANKVTQQLKDKSLTSAQKVAKEKSAQDYINKVNTFQSKLDTQVKNIIKSNNDNERNKKIKKLQDFVKQSDIFDTLEEDDTFYRRENWLRDYLKNAFEEAGLEEDKLLATLQRRQKKFTGGAENLVEDTVLDMVKDKSWFKRATEPEGELYKGKHTLLTTSMEADGKEYLFPTIREVNGKLKKLSNQKAFEEAMKNKDFLVFEGKCPVPPVGLSNVSK